MDAATRAGAGIDFVEEFASAAEWFADHLARAGMRTPVPTCPDWTLLDLVVHLANTHSWAATIVETGRPTETLDDRPASTKPRRVGDWYVGKAEDLYSVLRDTPGEQPCWNFAFGIGDAQFWQRRQTHETLMHGVDLAIATDVPERLPPLLATDAIDEALRVFLHRMHNRGHAADLVRPICLRTTDTGRAWVVEPVPRSEIPAQASPVETRRRERPAPRVVEGVRPGIDTVEGPAAVLLKVLWKRTRPDDPELQLTGDEHLIQRFLASRLTA